MHSLFQEKHIYITQRIEITIINEPLNICGAFQHPRSACKVNDHCNCRAEISLESLTSESFVEMV